MPANLRPHHLADILPLPTDAEFAALKADIESRGQRRPILLYRGLILDGRGRYRACRELGLDPTTEIYAGDDPLGEVLSLNLHRRHLTASQRRAVVAAVLLRNPARSNRTVANQAGVSHNTVAVVREELESTGQIDQLEATTGADGKERPARRPPTPPPSIADSTGASVPDRLRDVFGDPWLREAAGALDTLARTVGAAVVPIQLSLRGKGARYAPHLRAGDVADYLAEAVAVLREAREALAAAVPLAVCGACAGRGCGACGGSGWLPAGGAE